MSVPKCFISPRNLEDAFLDNSEMNTDAGIESCALLCGIIGDDHVRLTHVVFPRQRGTENTVEMIEESALDLYLIDKGLSVLGWIHTHPTQIAFLSSVDLHTQFAHQQLLPEAVAVVCAPRYSCNKWLRLTGEGMGIIADCPFRGFHGHVSKSKLFGPALNIVFDDSEVQVIDMRGSPAPLPAATPAGSTRSTNQVTGTAEKTAPLAPQKAKKVTVEGQ